MIRYSYVIAEGFPKQKVLIDEVLNKKLAKAIESLGTNGVTNVDVLPETGDEGKIYYNTTDNKYYIYTENGFTEFGSGVTKVTSLPEEGKSGVLYYNETDKKYYVYEGSNWINTDLNSGPAQVIYSEPLVTQVQGVAYDANTVATIFPYYIERDAYNILLPFSEEGIPYEGYVGVKLVPAENDGRLINYVGRFTVPVPNTFFQLQLPSTVGIPDDDDFAEGNGFEPGHVYEFNILHDTCMIKDITCTALANQREQETNQSGIPEQPAPGGGLNKS